MIIARLSKTISLQGSKQVKKTAKKTNTKNSGDGKLGRFRVGDRVVIRAIPFHYIGIIEALGACCVELAADAVWLADSGRWMQMLRDGSVNEAEPFPDGVSIGYGVIADVTRWRHEIPGQK